MEFDRDLRARQEVRLLAQQAQLAFEGLQKLDQSGLDRITEALSRAGALHAAELAREACAETGFGNERDKTEKNRFAAVRVFGAIRGLRTVGILRRDDERRVWDVGVPVGGIAGIVFLKYTSSTVIYKSLIALKAGSPIVFSPHPHAVRCTLHAARLMADYLGYDFLDSTCWLRFRLDGTVYQPASYEAQRRTASGRRVVIPGFYGAMPDGSVKTFTRGGSDITGALAAAALAADVYENWTDVSGFLMAGPKIVQAPRPIERITYAELRELSYIGAQVLHEGAVSPVREENIPLTIRNTSQPDHPGTMIRERFDEPELPDENLITGIAGRKDFSVITITKNGMASQAGVLRQILEVLERYGIIVDYLPSGIDTVSLVVSAQKVAPCLYPMLGDLQKELKPDSIHVTDNMAIVAAVGRKMAYKPGTSGRIFAKLGENGINIRMITQGPEELNIIVGVDGSDFERAIRVLYDSFVK